MKTLYKPTREIFPNPESASYDGLLAASEEISTELLFEAYSFGIFPWPMEGTPVLWFSPPKRGVLDFSEFYMPKSLSKFQKKTDYKITLNQAFDEVIEACAESKRPEQEGTWITKAVLEGYKQFHEEGYVHSVECWLNDKLVGGMYGVYVAGSFSGESMFYRESNSSKLCLFHLIEFLKSQGLTWMDIQMVTEHLKIFGGKEIPRSEFLARLENEKLSAKNIPFAGVIYPSG